jgi:multidrug efflux pump
VKLSEVSIQRPVLATVMSLAIILLGVVSYLRLPVREYPDIDPPIVSVSTYYRGASPSVVETEITDILEEQFSTIEGIRTMRSSSIEQGSVVTIEFVQGRNVDEAANDVRDRVSRIRGLLPDAAEDPIVEKVDVNAQPIIWLSLSSTRHSNLEVSDFGERVLKDHLQRLSGVASVFLGGERRYAMRVWLDPARMTSRGLTVSDVNVAIARANAEIPAGRVEGMEREFSVRTRGELSTAEEFGAIVVKQEGENTVRLRDVAQVEVGAEDERTAIRYNKKPALGLGIVKQKGASTIDVGHAVEEALPDLQKLLPDGMILEKAYNSAEFVEAAVNEVSETILIAVLLVVMVILVFLKSFRATIIPTLAIPVSIIGAFMAAFFLGYTINILTLLALVLAIGMVVDDAIIVLENIYRHMEMGKNRLRAAIDGSREIGFAVVATTITLVAVFVPLSFLTGNVGRLFREFGIMVGLAVLISGFTALTFTPMICSRLLRPLHGTSQSWATRSFDAFFEWLDRLYERVLRGSLRHRGWVLGAAVLLVAVSAYLARLIPGELVPTEDRSIGFGIVIAPEGSTLEYTDRYMKVVEDILLSQPESEGLFTATGLGFAGPGRVTNGFAFLRLKNQDEREATQMEVVQRLFPQLLSIPGILAFVVNPPSLGQDFGSPVEYVLKANSYDELQQAVGIMMMKAQALGYLVNLDSDLRLNKPQLDVSIDRERAAQAGVSVADIGTTLETMLGGRVVSTFKRGSKQYDVITQLRPTDRATPSTIDELYVRGQSGLIQLANLVDVQETVAPKELNHFNRVRSASITASLAPGVRLGSALDQLDLIAQNDLPPGIDREVAGQSREYRESSSNLYWLFGLSVIFIFLVLAAQFESFLHPLTILFTVPLAVFGALLSLYVFRQSINIYSQIGLIMLIGIVTKNAILIVEFANQLREQGLELVEAVTQAARLRLRPILMTSFSTALGILPIALGLGAGGESRSPLGVSVVGGVIFSTFLTLVMIPVVYTLMTRVTKTARPEAVGAEHSHAG